MPIFEYACPPCRKIFQFLSKRLKPTRKPVCPQCGNRRLVKEISQFAALKGSPEPKADGDDVRNHRRDQALAHRQQVEHAQHHGMVPIPRIGFGDLGQVGWRGCVARRRCRCRCRTAQAMEELCGMPY